MTSKDEELQNQMLQNQIEKSELTGNDGDAYAYKKVFDALQQEPDFHLPHNFADRVIQKVVAKKETSNDFMWFGIGIFMFASAAVVAIVLTDFKISFGALKFISGYPGLFIFCLGFILFIQWLDKKLIKPKASL